ncbi:MAG: sigma-54-dependent Fis family transcriptional regulator [Acidobacteria bacterium]|uniref:Sigma-54-dependent Fis family transcriptional regulator n=1 Tax=Candidatus Polarisedimenticola svalbardensis TaxID=2886004 RepID=A0A8J6Y006_9BACT|nr:sigma-54-dependent Fis family transcriptional regulator [Candidatus Polarisedimenticola svalbardensis]
MSLDLRLLVVDDEEKQRALLAGFFQELGAEVHQAGDGREALAMVRSTLLDVVVTDYRMPGMDGRELLREIKALNPEIQVVIVTAYGAVEDAVGCLKDGAADYLSKPLDLDEVEHVLERLAERRYLVRENLELKHRLGSFSALPGIVTAGGAMAEVLSTVSRVATSPVSVLLLGESGTGKELIARAIHQAGSRRDGPFLAVNGSALSPTLLESELFGHEKGAFTGAERMRIGRIEAAGGGTLFLDEIGDLPPEVQVKLLRVLQERTIERVGSTRPIPVDVRVISATHRDLLVEVREGRFREDLYYRLAVVAIEIPPLRSRRGDIPLLVEHFAARYDDGAGAAKPFSGEAMDLLMRYDYPGNVRELENIVQRALVLARTESVTRYDLPPAVQEGFREQAGPASDPLSLPARVNALKREMIENALEAEEGNQTRAAARLGISERALRYKLSKLRQ